MVAAVSGRAGYVYFLSNPSMPGLVKIGRTARHPEKRVSELTSATGVPTPFRLEGFIRTDDAVRTESEIHRRMGATRVNRRREFFSVDPRRAVAVARTVAKDERTAFSTGAASRSAFRSILHLALLFAYFNVALFIWHPGFPALWKIAAANAALAFLVPGRFWSRALRAVGRAPLPAHAAIVAVLATAAHVFRPGLGSWAFGIASSAL